MLLSEKLRLASCLPGDIYAPWRHVLLKGTGLGLRRVPIVVHGTGLYCKGWTQRCLTVRCVRLTPAKVETGTGFLSLLLPKDGDRHSLPCCIWEGNELED